MKTVQSGEKTLLFTQVVIVTLIPTAAARGRDMTTLGLFKERSPSVPITPHFTFHISSRLSEPLDRSQFIFLSPLLYTHTPSVTHIHALLGCLCASVSFQSLPFLSVSITWDRSILSVFLHFLSPPLSPHIPPWCEPSRDLVFFFFLLPPLPAVFDSSLRIRGDQGF